AAVSPFQFTMVFRGGAGKEIRPISINVLRWQMGAAKARIDQKEARGLVVVPMGPDPSPGGPPSPSWTWGAGEDDRVITGYSSSSAELVIAALDGKLPSASEHPVVGELSKSEGTFQPICLAFADSANCPEAPNRVSALLRAASKEWGIRRIDHRFG